MMKFNAIEKQKSFAVMELEGLQSVIPLTKFIRDSDSDARSKQLKFSIEYDGEGIMHLYFSHNGMSYVIAEGDYVVRMHDGLFEVLSENEFNDRFQTRV